MTLEYLQRISQRGNRGTPVTTSTTNTQASGGGGTSVRRQSGATPSGRPRRQRLSSASSEVSGPYDFHDDDSSDNDQDDSYVEPLSRGILGEYMTLMSTRF